MNRNDVSSFLPLAGIALLAAVLPLEHTPALRNVLGGSLALPALFLALRRRAGALPSPWLPAWVGLCLLSAAWSLNPQQSLSEAFGNVLLPVGCCLAGATWLSRERTERWLAWPLLASLSFILLAHWLYMAAGEADAVGWIQEIHDYWPGRGVASTLAVFALPLAAWLAARGRRWPGGALLVVALLVGSQNWNRMFWLAALTALLPCLFMFRLPRPARIAVIAVVALAIAGAFGYAVGGRASVDPQAPASVQEAVVKDPRWTIWPAWTELALQRPVLGHGLGYRTMQQLAKEKLPQSLYQFSAASFTHGHNLLLDTFVQLGAVGLALYLLLLGDLLRRFWRQLAAGAEERLAAVGGIALILGMLAKNATDDFMNFSSAILFWLMLGTFAKLAGFAGRKN